jgi:hypothetical protein
LDKRLAEILSFRHFLLFCVSPVGHVIRGTQVLFTTEQAGTILGFAGPPSLFMLGFFIGSEGVTEDERRPLVRTVSDSVVPDLRFIAYLQFIKGGLNSIVKHMNL